MKHFPSAIVSYIHSHKIEVEISAYLTLDHQGFVRGSGGDLSRFGIDGTGTGWDVTTRLSFMFGLLPLEGPFLSLEAIKLSPETIADVHIFQIDNGYGLLLLDTTEKGNRQKKVQQRVNEMKLRRNDMKFAAMNEMHLKDILSALNVLALERSSDGSFVLLSTPSDWMAQFSATLQNSNDESSVPNDCTFLGNFLIEASEFWNKKKPGCIRSGIWVEENSAGNKYMFEAIALTSLDKHILIIARDQKFYQDKQLLLQKGRELALDYQALSKLEEGLQHARAELELRVKTRTEELELSNKRLAKELKERKRLEEERARMERQLLQAQKMEAIGTLAGGIAHDFNNILSAIVGFAELSLMSSELDPTLIENLEKILSASSRAKGLVRQILTFSREAREDSKPIRIKQAVTEAIGFIRASVPDTIEIVHDLQSEGTIFANPSQIHQLIMNLCTNAAHAMQENGGILSVSLDNLSINSFDRNDTSALPSGDYIRLSVKDTGHGMTANTIEKIFDPFFTTRRDGQGTGLGLSVVHGIVKSNKGTIAVESKPGKGSVFHVYFPLYDTNYVQTPPEETVLPRGNERILVVDDEPMQTEIAIKRLQMLGYSVSSFTDSTQALRFFMKDPECADIVITDQAMPGLSGINLAEEMLRIRPDLPIIICTGFGDSIFEEKIQAIGIRTCLMKPLSIRDLATSIRNCLD